VNLGDVSEETLFYKLIKALEKNPNKSKSPGHIPGTGDVSEQWSEETKKEQGLTDEQADQKVMTAVAAAATAARERGSVPGFVEGIIAEINKPSNNWKKQLRQFVSAFDRDDFSYRRISRRSVGNEILRPSMYSEKVGEIVVIVDESGSVSDAELQQGLGEVTSIAKHVKPTGITVITCDTRVTGVTRFKPREKITFKTGGRGGTDMLPAFQRAAEIRNKCCIICFTDGELHWHTKKISAVPVLWAICNGGNREIKAPWGKTIRVEVQS
jgi:predicted metal-dependent peptidase